jgi:hypothetical protein
VLPALPIPPAPLGRGELLDAVAAAANAYASGEPSPHQANDIAGRSFRLKLPFGCFGQPAADAHLTYQWKAKTRTLKLSAQPQSWSDDPRVRALLGDGSTEDIEGFWVPRPWMTDDGCPAPPGAAASAQAPSPQTVALVRVFRKEDSRLQKHVGRPYEVTRKLDKGEAPGAGGYRLVLEGRIGGDEQEPPISCLSASPDRRPTCFVRVAFDHVAFEDPDGDRLAEWGG